MVIWMMYLFGQIFLSLHSTWCSLFAWVTISFLSSPPKRSFAPWLVWAAVDLSCYNQHVRHTVVLSRQYFGAVSGGVIADFGGIQYYSGSLTSQRDLLTASQGVVNRRRWPKILLRYITEESVKNNEHAVRRPKNFRSKDFWGIPYLTSPHSGQRVYV